MVATVSATIAPKYQSTGIIEHGIITGSVLRPHTMTRCHIEWAHWFLKIEYPPCAQNIHWHSKVRHLFVIFLRLNILGFALENALTLTQRRNNTIL